MSDPTASGPRTRRSVRIAPARPTPGTHHGATTKPTDRRAGRDDTGDLAAWMRKILQELPDKIPTVRVIIPLCQTELRHPE
jgi:hypothetical protein